MSSSKPQDSRLHRGTLHDPEVRYRRDSLQAEDDGWFSEGIEPSPVT